jgi:hypothetical protein
MKKTPWIKLFALGAMVWMVFGASAVGLSWVIGFGFLFALLDASAGVEEGSGEKREDRKRQKPLMEDSGAFGLLPESRTVVKCSSGSETRRTEHHEKEQTQ